MSRPAGYSDDEDDSDYETFGFEPIRPIRNRVNNVQERVRSPEEKLFDAVYQNDPPAVTAALNQGADIHFRIKDNTPIMEAAYQGYSAVLELLIQNGANVDDDHKMSSVVMCLCMSWSKEEEELLKCLKLLLEHGADPKATNWTLATPLMLAVKHDHILLVTHFLEIKCDVNGADCDGYTPIIFAAQNENLAMVKLLVDSGANVNVMDRRGNGLVDITQVSSNPELAALLGIHIEDDTGEVVQLIKPSPYKMAMLSLPKKADRMYGFHEDAVRFVRGIGLYDVSKILEQNNVQLAELLTWSDDEWKRANVHISYYSRKIELCVKKYHEHAWGTDAIPKVESCFVNDEVDLFNVVLFLMDFLRVMHISSATSLYMLKNCTPLQAEAVKDIEQVLHYNAIATQQLQSIKTIVLDLESTTSTVPADLITINDAPKRNSSFGLRFVGLVFNLCLSWSLPVFSDIKF